MEVKPGTIIVSNVEFERKWHRFEIGVWIALSLLLASAIAGAMGRGPMSRTKSVSADGHLTVSYDKVIRMHSNSEIEVIFERPSTGKGEVRLALGGALLKEVPVQSTQPLPAGSQAGGKWSKLIFLAERNEPARILITQRGGTPGRVMWTLVLENGSSVTGTQVVLP